MWSAGMASSADAAELRAAALHSKAVNDAKALAAADRAREAGNLSIAVRIYARVGSRYPPNDSTLAARQWLAQLKPEVRQKLSRLDQQLIMGPGVEIDTSPGMDTGNWDQVTSGSRWADTIVSTLDEVRREPKEAVVVMAADTRSDHYIIDIFHDYDRLVSQFGGMPEVGNEITSHVAKLRRQPEYAAILNESTAKELWLRGQKFEHENHLCCAYWAYRGAQGLLPAPSAKLACDRFAELDADAQIVESAKRCRELQQCHKLYARAERLAKVDPAGARSLLREVVKRAPPESEVRRAAEDWLR